MNILALDTETALSTEHCKAPALACVSWTSAEGVGLIHWTDPALRGWLAEQLAKATIVGHTIHYDFGVLLAQFPELTPLVFQAYADGRVLDIRLAQKLADIAAGEHESPRHMVNGRPYTLEAMAFRHLGRVLDKDTWRLLYGKLRELPLDLWPEGAKVYPIEDARGTLDCYRAIAAKYKEVALGDLARQTRHAFALHLITCWGIRTDTELVEQVKANTIGRQAALAQIILEAGLLRQEKKGFVKSTKVAKARMLEKTPPELRRLTKTGFERKKKGLPTPWEEYVSTDAEACYVSGDPVLVAYAGYASLGTRISSQFPHLLRGEIHTKFESLRETGRSASGGDESDGSKTSYNVQNQPQGDPAGKLLGERECCVPRPGKVFGDNDYGGLELCTGAQMNIDLHGRSEMAKVLGRAKPYDDCHLDFAGHILRNTDFEWLLKNKKTPAVAVARDTAKKCNFGLGGGMGGPKFAGICNKNDAKLFIATGARPGHTISVAEAVALKATWLTRWPEWALHFAWAKSLTGTYNKPRHARIKQLRVDRWRGGIDYATTCNAPFQALGADVAKDALWEVVRAMYDITRGSVLFDSRVVNFIHDDILSEFPEQRAHECAIEQTRIMNEVSARFLPDCPSRTAPTLARRFSKGAAELYGPDGRLLVWEHPALERKAA